jgi:hypothetical protein
MPCRAKRFYASAKDAAAVIDILERVHRVRDHFFIYVCRECRGWHLTTKAPIRKPKEQAEAHRY